MATMEKAMVIRDFIFAIDREFLEIWYLYRPLRIFGKVKIVR